MIELIIINSLIIWGVYASLQEGFIFEKIGNWIRGKREKIILSPYPKSIFRNNLPSWIKKPLATCPICMSSVYGTPVFWPSYYMELINFDFIIIVYICYIFALAGLQYLILTFIPESKSNEVEYKILFLNESQTHIDNELNAYASNGWKINHILNQKRIGGALQITYLMERNK